MHFFDQKDFFFFYAFFCLQNSESISDKTDSAICDIKKQNENQDSNQNAGNGN